MTWTSRSVGTSRLMRFKKLRNSSVRLRLVIDVMTLPLAVSRAACRLVSPPAFVVVGAPLRGAGHDRQDGRGAVEGLHFCVL